MKWQNKMVMGSVLLALSGNPKEGKANNVLHNKIEETKSSVLVVIDEEKSNLEGFIKNLHDKKDDEVFLKEMMESFEVNDVFQKEKEYYVLFYLGRIERSKKNYEESEKHLETASRIVDTYGLGVEKKSEIEIAMGLNDYEKGQYKEAYKHYKKVLDLYEVNSIKNKKHKADALNNIGNLFLNIQGIVDIDEALYSIQEAIEIARDIQEEEPENYEKKESLFFVMNTLGRLYTESSNLSPEKKEIELKKAKNQFESVLEAIQKERENEFLIIKGDVLNNLGSVDFQLGNLIEAFEYYEQSFDLAKETNDTELQAICLFNQAHVYFKMAESVEQGVQKEGLFKSPEESKEKAELLLKEIHLIENVPNYIRLQVLEQLQEFYAQEENYEEAYKAISQIKDLRESIGKTEIQKEYVLQKEEAKRLKIEKEKELMEQKLVLGGVVALMMFFVVMWEVRRNKLLKNKNNELEEKDIILSEKNADLEQKDHELKILLQDFKDKNSELMDSNQALESFFANVGHDVKNKMAAVYMTFETILAMLQRTVERKNDEELKKYKEALIQMKSLAAHTNITEEDQKEILTIAEYFMSVSDELLQGNERISNLIEGKFVYVKGIITYLLELQMWAENRSLEPQKKDIEMKRFLEEQILSGWGEKIKNKNITFNVDCDDSVCVNADRQMLVIILENLVGNAIKYTHDNGNISVSVLENDFYTDICVEDDGIGMDDAKQSHIFNSTKVVSEKGTHGEIGTGFGLRQVSEFVKKQEAEITVESVVQKGTKFRVRFPKEQK